MADGPGLNFGWPRFEGFASFSSQAALTGPATPPVYAIDHMSSGAASVMSAGIYRRPPGASHAFPAAYTGSAFFSDYYAGFLRRMVWDGSSWRIAPPVAGQASAEDWGSGFENVSDYAVGPDGALWYCRQFDGAFSASSGEIGRVFGSESASVDPVPRGTSFAIPYPQPSAGTVDFAWTLATRARVSLAIHDIRGRRLRRLVTNHAETAGAQHFRWDGRDAAGNAVATGVYFARLVVDGHSFEQRVTLVR